MDGKSDDARRNSRERFLEAGQDELFDLVDSASFHPYRLISPTAVAERSGLSKAMLYNLWPLLPEDETTENMDRLQRFRNDLAARVCADAYDNESVNEVAAEALAAGASLGELIRAVAEHEFDRLRSGDSDRRFRVFVLTEVAAKHAPGELGEQLRGINTVENERNAQTYEFLLGVYNRRPIAPLTYGDLALMASAITDGFVLRALNPPEGVEMESRQWHESMQGPWTLMGIALNGLFHTTTEEIGISESSASSK